MGSSWFTRPRFAPHPLTLSLSLSIYLSLSNRHTHLLSRFPLSLSFSFNLIQAFWLQCLVIIRCVCKLLMLLFNVTLPQLRALRPFSLSFFVLVKSIQAWSLQDLMSYFSVVVSTSSVAFFFIPFDWVQVNFVTELFHINDKLDWRSVVAVINAYDKWAVATHRWLQLFLSLPFKAVIVFRLWYLLTCYLIKLNFGLWFCRNSFWSKKQSGNIYRQHCEHGNGLSNL